MLCFVPGTSGAGKCSMERPCNYSIPLGFWYHGSTFLWVYTGTPHTLMFGLFDYPTTSTTSNFVIPHTLGSFKSHLTPHSDAVWEAFFFASVPQAYSHQEGI